MCGLIGFISKSKWYQPKKKEVLTQLIYADTVRGMDSTGVYFVSEQGNVMYKRALPGFDFIHTRTYLSLLNKLDPLAVLGHNRAATHGAVNDDNSHPFKSGKITLTHNGVVYGYPTGKYDVDSKWLADILNVDGPEGLKEVQGSYALVWHDSATKNIHFIRNEARAFYYAVCPDVETMFYASEKHMLEWVLTREQVKFTSIEEVVPSTLYTISTTDLSISLRTINLEKEKKQENSTWNKRFEYYQHGQGKYNAANKNLPNTYSRSPNSECKVTDLRTSANSLSIVGMKEGDLLEVEIDDIDTKMKFASMVLIDPPKELKDYALTIKYPYEPEEETALFSYVGDKITVKIARAKSYSAYKRIILYVEEIVKIPDHATGEILSYEDLDMLLQEKTSTALTDIPCLPGPDKSLISIDRFNELTKFGCSCCQGNIEEIDVYSMSWFNSTSPICPDCTQTFLKEAQ